MTRKNFPDKTDSNTAQMAELLSPEEQAELLREAKAQAQDEMKAEARKKFLQNAKLREMQKLAGIDTRAASIHEDTEDVPVDLGTTAPYIMLDGKVYMHGFTYNVTVSVAESIKDIMFQTHRHEMEVQGQNTNSYYGRKHMNTRVSPRGAMAAPR